MDGKNISSISQLNPTSRVSKNKKTKQKKWNFFEASHGKGAPGGVGGALKRTADYIVDHGGNIPSAQGFYDKLKIVDTSVELFFVPEWDTESNPEVIVN